MTATTPMAPREREPRSAGPGRRRRDRRIAGLLDVTRMDAEERRLRLLAKSSVLQMRARDLVDPCWVARAVDRMPTEEP